MFLVSDSVESKRSKIEAFMNDGEPSIALLLAVIDLERTLRRAILALGKTPTPELGKRLGKRLPNKDLSKGEIGYRSGLDGLNDAWKDEVQKVYKTPLHSLTRYWSTVKKACDLRNELVHGARARTTREFSKRKIEAVIDLTQEIHEFTLSKGQDLNKPVRRRLKERVL